MSEVAVVQRSPEWRAIRAGCALTASQFGDAVGVGQGRPYDFLVHLLDDDGEDDDVDDSASVQVRNMAHGIALEPVIREAYELLTGNVTANSGVWLPSRENPLHGLVAATPDAKVLARDDPAKTVGLAEFKAPVYSMYSSKRHPPWGIPRRYMAQIQGQMAVSGLPWCDFMAVCLATREIILKRVHFNPTYWSAVGATLKNFCDIKIKALRRRASNLEPLDFSDAQTLRTKPVVSALFPGEGATVVRPLLESRTTQESGVKYKSLRGVWFTFDFLMGTFDKSNS